MRSHGVRVDSRANDWCPYKERRKHRHMGATRRRRHRLEGWSQAEDAKGGRGHVELAEARKASSPGPRRGRDVVLLTSGFWTSSPQDCGRIHFCGFKPRHLRSSVTAAPGNR